MSQTVWGFVDSGVCWHCMRSSIYSILAGVHVHVYKLCYLYPQAGTQAHIL